MGLHKLDIKKSGNGLINLENEFTLSRKFITEITKNINKYYEKNIVFPKVFVSLSLSDYLYNERFFAPSSISKIWDGNLIGKLMGTNIYMSSSLDDNEYFIGLNEREIEITKRTDKINKILKNER
jgi:hypothetical protein